MALNTKTLLAAAAATAVITTTASATVVYSEDWEYAKTNGDINADTGLHESVGYGLNDNNPTTLLGAGVGGNVRVDQPGFGGSYGTGDNAGTGVRVRSSNGALLNRDAMDLSGFASAVFSFDLKQVTANYVHVIEFSEDQAFTSPVLLDTIDGLGTVGLWEAKSYNLVDGEGGVNLTANSYIRIRKLRPSPAGTTAGANSTFHVYDNIVVEGVVPEPSSLALLGLGGLLVARRRRA